MAEVAHVTEGAQLSWFDVRTTVDDGGRPVVVVSGDLDIASAPVLREALVYALFELPVDGSPALVIDLAGMTFIDAAGIGVLVGAAKQARRLGRSVVLRNPSAHAMRMLQITALHRAFEVERSQLVAV